GAGIGHENRRRTKRSVDVPAPAGEPLDLDIVLEFVRRLRPPIPLRRQEKLSWPFTGPSQRLSVKVGSRETSPVPRSFRREPVGSPTVSPRSSPRGWVRKSRTAGTRGPRLRARAPRPPPTDRGRRTGPRGSPAGGR